MAATLKAEITLSLELRSFVGEIVCRWLPALQGFVQSLHKTQALVNGRNQHDSIRPEASRMLNHSLHFFFTKPGIFDDSPLIPLRGQIWFPTIFSSTYSYIGDINASYLIIHVPEACILLGSEASNSSLAVGTPPACFQNVCGVDATLP